MQFHCVYSIPLQFVPLQFIYFRVAVYSTTIVVVVVTVALAELSPRTCCSEQSKLQMENNTIAFEDVRLFCKLEHCIKYSSDQKSIKYPCLLFLLTTLRTCPRTTVTPYQSHNSQCYLRCFCLLISWSDAEFWFLSAHNNSFT